MSHTGRYTDHGLFVYVDNGDAMTFKEWFKKTLWPDIFKELSSSDREAIVACATESWNAALENQWVSVEDRLPPDGVGVIVLDSTGNVCDGFHKNRDGWHIFHNCYSANLITHWMLTPPK